MTEFLHRIIAPQIDCENSESVEKFLRNFCDLYRIELFKDGLDLILTKLKEKQLRFEIKFINGWDTNLGCFLTEQRNYYDESRGQFLRVNLPKIILRNLSHNLMAHEMAHALEFESGINFGEDFRKAIGFDMKNREPQSLVLKGEIKRLMIDALKLYKPSQFLSELFARYFELLSISRNVNASGSFTTSDVMEFFANSTNFLEKIFNPKIRAKIDPEIARLTSEIVKKIRLPTFQEKVDPLQKKSNSWAGNIRSNAIWSKGLEKSKLEEEKK